MNNIDSNIIDFTNNEDIYKEISRTDKISQPYLTKYAPSKAPVVEKLQQEPH